MFVGVGHSRSDEERHRARELRAGGTSLSAIAQALGIAKSTASLWMRDVPRGGRPSVVPLPPGALATRRLPVWRSGGVRRCGRCGHLSPLELFSRHGSGRQWWCRPCFLKYHSLRREDARAAAARRKLRARAIVAAHLATHPCADCGDRDLAVLEFDHVAGKRRHVSWLVHKGAPPARLHEEIARCEVVCANCHRMRTAARAGWRRLAPEGDEQEWRSARVERNVRFAYRVLEASGCADCGERRLTVLDFDHVDGKESDVLRLAWNEAGLARLEAEIARCEVRCANCHRRRTHAARLRAEGA